MHSSPRGDIKKISFESDPVTVTDYYQTTGDDHWRVADWDVGSAQPGSSGSPLFDNNHRIIGQLHGSDAACGNSLPDWFGGLFSSWEGDGTPQTLLRDWLDPDGTGTTTLNGYDAGPSGIVDISAPNLTVGDWGTVSIAVVAP